MKKLAQQLQEFESYLTDFEKENSSISNATVGWQIEHSLLVMNSIINRLQEPKEIEFKSKFNLKKCIIFTTKKIPRGKVKAPKIVLPAEKLDLKSLQELVLFTQKNILKLNKIDPNAFFEHRIFGHLNLKHTIRFLKIHNLHHIKIIKDIIK